MSLYSDLIANALAEIGVLAAGETPSAGDVTFCLGKLNRMIDQWNTRKNYVYYIREESFAFGTSKQSYTIGKSTADFDTVRPVRIVQANLVLVSSTPNVQLPLNVMNVQDYAALRVPALSSTFPTRLYYQATYPNGTLWPWPYPTDVSNKLDLYMWSVLESVASGDTVALPPGYEEAVTLTLAESLCPAYGRSLSPELAEQARKARYAISGLNSEPPTMGTDVPGGGSRPFFNYLTGNLR